MEEIVGISVMMAVGDDINEDESSYQISIIPTNDSFSQSFTNFEPSRLESLACDAHLINGENSYDENDIIDEELVRINQNVDANCRNISEIVQKLSPNSESTSQSNFGASLELPTSSASHSSAASCLSDTCCASSSSAQSSDVVSDSDYSVDSNNLNDNTEQVFKKPLQNEAEHMLLAVRRINTPWAKELENRLANEIKLEDKSKKEINMMKNKIKKGTREHINLMKAMKEIGTGWAQDIEKANYLQTRNRGNINYNVSRKHKQRLPKSKSTFIPVQTNNGEKMHGYQYSKKHELNKQKQKMAAQLILKKTVNVSYNKQKSNIGPEDHTNKVIEDKSKYKTRVKLSDKVSKNVELRQVCRTNCVPSINSNSATSESAATVKHPTPLNNKPNKHFEMSNISETNLKNIGKVKSCISNVVPQIKQRYSARQQVTSSVYKEIGVKKHGNFMQIIFFNKKSAAFLSVQALKELKTVFISAKHDSSCKLILLNGSGRVFCTGVDLTPISFKDNHKVVNALASALRDFLKIMISFPKPIIAGVNGSAVGLGVTILPLCDLIYASDKATFSTPYTKLSQVPEGGASFSFPHILGPAIASDMLLCGRILTAQEACQHGLVSQVIWPSQFMETLFPKVEKLATESSQGMEATKQLMKACFKSQLGAHIDKECGLLKEQWSSRVCQKAIHKMVQNNFFLHV